jgi:hypothetical protein
MTTSRRIKHLIAAAGLAGSVAVGAPAALAAVDSAQSAPPPGEPTPAARQSYGPTTGSQNCDGKGHHRTLVRYNDNPVSGGSFTGTGYSDNQQVTTSAAQGWETLVVTFNPETYTYATGTTVRMDILVDGNAIEPTDGGGYVESNEVGYSTASITRCIRVPVGVHQVRARIDATGGSAWIDDYTLRIDRFA